MIHESARTGFERQADVYAAVRPTYRETLVDRFVENFASGVVVELGAGTGIFTSQLIAAGVEPLAIEPVAAMRQSIVAAHPGLTVVDGTAEHTGLHDHSVDTVVAAQAFHWFDHDKTLVEMQRILRPGGIVVCVWNVLDDSVDWVRRYTEIVDRFAGDTPRHRTMKWRNAIETHPDFELIDDWTTPNPKPSTPQDVLDRALSTSFIAALDPRAQRAVLSELRTVTSELGEHLEFPYRSELQAWRTPPPHHRGSTSIT